MVSSLNFKSNRMATGRSRIPSNSIPQVLCPDPIINLAQLAAVKAREAAEAYFTLRHFDCAIMQARAAKELYPEFPGMDNYMAAYQIHSAVSHKKNWYHVLGITNPAVADSEAIKKQYKRLALALHPDKNGSIAADGAFKYVKAAWDVLSNRAKRESYDKSLSPRSQGLMVPITANQRSSRGPMPVLAKGPALMLILPVEMGVFTRRPLRL